MPHVMRIVHAALPGLARAGVALLVCHPAPAFSQGSFAFSNARVGEPIRVFDPVHGACILPLGDDWHADFLAGVPAKGLALAPVSPALDFYAGFGPGYLTGHIFYMPGTVGGDVAEVYVRAFRGPSFDAATARGIAGPFTVILVAPPGGPYELSLPPGSLDMCIPEPRTMALLMAGLAGLCIARCSIGCSTGGHGQARRAETHERLCGHFACEDGASS